MLDTLSLINFLLCQFLTYIDCYSLIQSVILSNCYPSLHLWSEEALSKTKIAFSLLLVVTEALGTVTSNSFLHTPSTIMEKSKTYWLLQYEGVMTQGSQQLICVEMSRGLSVYVWPCLAVRTGNRAWLSLWQLFVLDLLWSLCSVWSMDLLYWAAIFSCCMLLIQSFPLILLQ